MNRVDYEKRREIGQAFLRLATSPDWIPTVDAFMYELQQSLDALTLTSVPPEKVQELAWMAHGKREFIEAFKSKMQEWMADAEMDDSFVTE